MTDFRDSRAMPASDARAILHRLRWSQKEAAYRLGVSYRHMKRYLREELPPRAAELLRHIEREEER